MVGCKSEAEDPNTSKVSTVAGTGPEGAGEGARAGGGGGVGLLNKFEVRTEDEVEAAALDWPKASNENVAAGVEPRELLNSSKSAKPFVATG